MNEENWPPESKAVEEIWETMDLFDSQIDALKEYTAKALRFQKNAMWEKLNTAFMTHTNELKAD